MRTSATALQDRRQIANMTLGLSDSEVFQSFARIVATGWTLGIDHPGAHPAPPLTVVTGVDPDPATGYGGNSPGSQRAQSDVAECLFRDTRAHPAAPPARSANNG